MMPAIRDDPSSKPPFDPKAFLAEVGVGISIKQYPKNEMIFAQGDSADTVCYIQAGEVVLISGTVWWQGQGGFRV